MSSTPLPRTSNPATRALETIGVTTLEQLATHTRREIAGLHGMGPKALGILEAAMAELGIGFVEA